MREIVYWNRKSQKEEKEKVYGDAPMRWLYQTALGQLIAERVLTRPGLSQIVGRYHSSRLSSAKVKQFIRSYSIPMEEYEGDRFHSFNEFFIRRFKEGKRPFAESLTDLPAFAEARYLAYASIDDEQTFPVKGKPYNVAELLDDPMVAGRFLGGPLLIARLCPTDYHRFHYPDSGRTIEYYRVGGKLHSVNPVALAYKPDILATNERRVSVLETENFGDIAYIEVGAMCVGKIVQTHSPDLPFKRGEEKGYFLFGGSTVVVLGQPDKWVIDSDLLEQTRKGRESWVPLGQKIARKISP